MTCWSPISPSLYNLNKLIASNGLIFSCFVVPCPFISFRRDYFSYLYSNMSRLITYLFIYKSVTIRTIVYGYMRCRSVNLGLRLGIESKWVIVLWRGHYWYVMSSFFLEFFYETLISRFLLIAICCQKLKAGIGPRFLGPSIWDPNETHQLIRQEGDDRCQPS
jgi:hypothetical protein